MQYFFHFLEHCNFSKVELNDPLNIIQDDVNKPNVASNTEEEATSKRLKKVLEKATYPKCGYCHKIFTEFSNLKVHIAAKHKVMSQCDFCHEIFNQLEDLHECSDSKALIYIMGN